MGTGLSLIVAIGAQNAYVLRQGLRRDHVGVIVAICTASDVALIAAGIGGLGALVRQWPRAVAVVALIGGLFLIGYGLRAAMRVLRPDKLDAARADLAEPACVLGHGVAARFGRQQLRRGALVLRGRRGDRERDLVHRARIRRAAAGSVLRQAARLVRARRGHRGDDDRAGCGDAG
jgi:threonine/homoserine/homoserine lactone efflux protein